MVQRNNSMAHDSGDANTYQAQTVQQLMERAVKRRDELTVFIRVLTDALRDEVRTSGGATRF